MEDRPLYEQVRARLTEAISAGRWRAGQSIPSEAELALTFGVAIGTVRKAVDALVAERALVRRQGKGTFVTQHDGSRLMFHFFHIVGRDGSKAYPEVRMLSFARDDKVIRLRNLLSLDARPSIVDDITLPAGARRCAGH
jgi:GntR family transcriptional regulator